jgi:toxin-antitoxin system PIN domain toxin
MISADTNILFAAVVPASAHHAAAAAFLRSLDGRDDVAVSEFALVELYGLLRNPAVVEKPLPAAHAAEACRAFRAHARWRIAGFAPDGRALHDQLWRRAGEAAFPRRRIYDLRMALSLVQHGVTEFATVNTKDFQGAGFRRVWNPLEEGAS